MSLTHTLKATQNIYTIEANRKWMGGLEEEAGASLELDRIYPSKLQNLEFTRTSLKLI